GPPAVTQPRAHLLHDHANLHAPADPLPKLSGTKCEPIRFAWTARMEPHPFLKDVRHLIVDRAPLYTAPFKDILASANVELLRLPARSPNLNAYAERFVGSIKSECLRHSAPRRRGREA